MIKFQFEVRSEIYLNKTWQKIEKFFSSIIRDQRLSEKGELIIKTLNVAYDNQVVCIM